MDQILSIEEINARYPDEWVLIGDPATDESLEVLRGKVLFHSAERDEVYRKANELRPERAAFHFSGPVGKNAMRFALGSI